MPAFLKIIILTLSLSLSACMMPGPMKKDYSLKDKKIAIVSDLGNNFQSIVVGTTVFSNEFTKTDVTDWQINALAAQHISKHLETKGLSGSIVESNVFPSLEDSSRAKIDKIALSIIPKVKTQGFDSLILVRPSSLDNEPFYKPGFGQQKRYFFGIPKGCLYAIYMVEIYDLHREELVGIEWMNARQGPCEPRYEQTFALKDKFEDYSEQEKILIRDRMKKHMNLSLTRTLHTLQLH